MKAPEIEMTVSGKSVVWEGEEGVRFRAFITVTAGVPYVRDRVEFGRRLVASGERSETRVRSDDGCPAPGGSKEPTVRRALVELQRHAPCSSGRYQARRGRLCV